MPGPLLFSIFFRRRSRKRRPVSVHTTGEVIFLKYYDLYELLADDSSAKQYYERLPDYVKAQIGTRPQGVNSFESLKDYAENLTRGDG